MSSLKRIRRKLFMCFLKECSVQKMACLSEAVLFATHGLFGKMDGMAIQ